MNLPSTTTSTATDTATDTRTNTGAVLYGTRDLRIEPRPVPAAAPHEVLVEIRAVGICGSDVHYYEHGRIGPYVVETPMVVGHESAGTIVGVGRDVSPARIGETVALEPGVPCRRCPQCLAGRYNLCPDVVFFATPPVDGSISTYVTIDAAFAHPAPVGLGFDQAAMAEPVSVGVWAAQKAHISVGDRVLITGAGPIGLLAGQVAVAFGASVVTVTDVSDFRLQTARKLGLGAMRADAPIDGEYDVLLECSGAAAALTAGMRTLAPAARVVLVGMGADTVSIDVPLIQGKEISLTGIFRYANTYPTALDLIMRGAVNVDAVITHRFDLEHTEDALTIGRRDPLALKAIVTPGR
ncbi:NAD(P)-dependent alcohol dehydrogenase [Cryobacterium frigoriphilum]|uniref:NAD(P)-dependent alcohol dehydrogenase n=1 Tax=Cryobacterium frigoriphilum TaxID=1259150 RepID=A0A4V3IRI9_9MICO|nr:NAD(P)-dependent alcohol dehydrogenase [Cryobacterium frigoriphilum]TFD52259.1 NAD(P)-dependent alcohol dehydrogenase [Cryobacterium frigoriphilum]